MLHVARKRDSTLTCYDMQNYKSRTAALGVGLCFGPPGRARPGEVNRRLATATRAAGAARRGPRLPTREPLALAPLGPGPGGASVTAGERAAAPRRRAPEGPESPARHLKVGYLRCHGTPPAHRFRTGLLIALNLLKLRKCNRQRRRIARPARPAEGASGRAAAAFLAPRRGLKTQQAGDLCTQPGPVRAPGPAHQRRRQLRRPRRRQPPRQQARPEAPSAGLAGAAGRAYNSDHYDSDHGDSDHGDSDHGDSDRITATRTTARAERGRAPHSGVCRRRTGPVRKYPHSARFLLLCSAAAIASEALNASEISPLTKSWYAGQRRGHGCSIKGLFRFGPRPLFHPKEGRRTQTADSPCDWPNANIR